MEKEQKYYNKDYLNTAIFIVYFLAFTLGWYRGTRTMVMVNLVTFVVLVGINYKTIKSLFEKKYVLLWGLIGLQIYRIVLNQFVLGISFRQEEKEIFWILAIVNTALVLVSVNSETVLKAVRDMGMCLGFVSVFEVLFMLNPLNLIVHADKIETEGALHVMEQLRCQSIFNNEIIYATFVVIVWSIFLCYPYKNSKKNATMTVITFVTIFGTGARSSWIPFFIITVHFCLRNYKKYKGIWLAFEYSKRRMLVGLGIVSVAILGWFVKEKLMHIVERMTFKHIFSGTAATIRKGNIVNVLQAYITDGSIGTRIFGTGMGGAATVVHNNPILGWDSVPDNQYLTFLYDYGIIIILLFIVIGGVVLANSWREKKNAYARATLYMGIELAISLFFWEGLENGSILIYTTMVVVLCCKENIGFQKNVYEPNKGVKRWQNS